MKITHVIIKCCLVVTLAYLFSSFFLPGKITAVYHGVNYDPYSQKNYRSTVILVDNPPLTKSGILNLWGKYISTLKNKNELLQGEEDEVLFVKSNLTRAFSSQELKYWQGDNQICLRGIFKGKCINNTDILMKISFFATTSSDQITRSFQNKVIYIDMAK